MTVVLGNSPLSVAVKLERCARPTVHWTWSGNHFTELELKDYCCVIPEFPDAAHRTDAVSLFSDRYGGEGIGFCGGSARCATSSDVQIKGVGLTPLYGARPGSEPEILHSGGTIDLLDAGHEAIMSSICGEVLPYGAVPTLALMSTGTFARAAFAKPGSPPSVPRVILLRRFAWRPAHFLRNIHFRPHPEFGISNDSARVRFAAQKLPEIFERELSVERTKINEGLLAIAARFAKQLAAAHAKRIFHGGLSASNIALDGRFLDFGTCTAVPAYRRRIGAPKPGGADIWNQGEYIERILLSMRQQLERYLPRPSDYKIVPTLELLQEFRCHHDACLAIEFSKLSGIPEDALLLMPRRLLDDAYRCMREIALRGSRRYILKEGFDTVNTSAAPLQSIGWHDLNEALRAYAGRELGGSTTLRESLGDPVLADTLSRCLDALYFAYRGQQPAEYMRSLRTPALQRCLRLNGPLSFLVRESIYDGLRNFEKDLSGVGDFIDSIIKNAVHILSD